MQDSVEEMKEMKRLDELIREISMLPEELLEVRADIGPDRR
jgi:hypothetical protein